MKTEHKRCLILYLVATILLLKLSHYNVQGDPQVPCFFVFGDSLVDNGNNNKIASLAKANYMPYGVDFPKGTTGRFSNGKTVADAINDLLGFDDYIQPYSNASGDDILQGVNYASAASGIKDETGYHLGARFSFGEQVNNYVTTVSQLVGILGSADSAANHLKRCIFYIGLGSNDYLNNYFMPLFYGTSRIYTPRQYANVLIQLYAKQIRILYNYGARKFVFNGIGMIGCSPYMLARYSQDGLTCVANINSALQLFNRQLASLVDNYNKNLPDAKFIYINNYAIFQDLLNRPHTFGFKVTNIGCCGVGRNNGQFTCLPFEKPCQNRNEYIFWDAYHPTEAAGVIFASTSYDAASLSDVYPIDIRRLAQL